MSSSPIPFHGELAPMRFSSSVEWSLTYPSPSSICGSSPWTSPVTGAHPTPMNSSAPLSVVASLSPEHTGKPRSVKSCSAQPPPLPCAFPAERATPRPQCLRRAPCHRQHAGGVPVAARPRHRLHLPPGRGPFVFRSAARAIAPGRFEGQHCANLKFCFWFI
jgi:hypothetical protein